jgi:hypothetical protein
MGEDVSFEHKKDIPIPEKGDIRTEKMIADAEKKVKKDAITGAVEEKEGVAKEKVGTLTHDVPQMGFRVIAGVIDCKKFELSEDEARIFAHHLNILLPLEGKVVSVFVILMIVLNKVYICMDAIKRLQNKGALEPQQPKQAELPEQLK